jgi:hypothetical protein
MEDSNTFEELPDEQVEPTRPSSPEPVVVPSPVDAGSASSDDEASDDDDFEDSVWWTPSELRVRFSSLSHRLPAFFSQSDLLLPFSLFALFSLSRRPSTILAPRCRRRPAIHRTSSSERRP